MTVDLRLGDCLEIMKMLPDGCVDAVVTDPPYSSGTRREAARGLRKSMNRATPDDEWFGTDQLTTNGFVWLLRSCALEWHRLLVNGGHALCFIDWRMASNLSAAIESADMRLATWLVWDKMQIGMGSCFRNQHEFILHFSKGVGRPPNRRDVANVLRFSSIRGGEHPTEKPVDLMRILVDVVIHDGETVLDPFMGSGTTGVACVQTGRNFIGIDIDPAYFAIAKKRIEEAQLQMRLPLPEEAR